MKLAIEALVASCDDGGRAAGITIRSQLEPVAGAGAPVKPPTYAGDGPGVFQVDERWWGDPPARTTVIVLDNVPSQANRLEAALQGLADELGLPRVVLDLSEIDMPSHLLRRIDGYRFPHRHADAYLRDAMLDGQAFKDTDFGRQLLTATSDSAEILLAWFPQSLLFGYWQSHLGKKRSQAKLARAWVSEIAGYDPATNGTSGWTRALALKGDPLNLSSDERVVYDENDLLSVGWTLDDSGAKPSGGKKKEKLSEIGHGQVTVRPSDAALTGVSFRGIEQASTVSFAGLRRVNCRTPVASAAARALLVALGLVAHVAAFERSFSLRSGCDLRAAASSWRWIGEKGAESIEVPTLGEVENLFRSSVAAARDAGLLEGGGWGAEPLLLKPNAGLREAIAKTWPLT